MRTQVPFQIILIIVGSSQSISFALSFRSCNLSLTPPGSKSNFLKLQQARRITLLSSSESNLETNDEYSTITSKKSKKEPKRFREKKNDPQQIKAKSIAKGRDPLISLNMNLDYLAKTGAAKRAEELLLKIEKLFEEG